MKKVWIEVRKPVNATNQRMEACPVKCRALDGLSQVER